MTDLGRLLSLKSAVTSTTPVKSATLELTKIGAGTCGTILTQPGSDIAFKLAKHDTDALTGDVFNDFKMHSAVLLAMKSVGDGDGVDFPRIPSICQYVSSSDLNWWTMTTAFSAAVRDDHPDIDIPCNTLCSERITPLPLQIRSGLIETFCPESLKAQAHVDPSNSDCLVRIYLGARKRPDAQHKRFFSLRNYKLHLDQILGLGIDASALSRAMAGALAIMHWRARIDAKDVEFALGLSPKPDPPGLLLDQRTSDLWLLDFNLCSTITMDDAGVIMAAMAWRVNDPYYPKPLQDRVEDQELWSVFVSRYIEISDELLKLEPTLIGLPRRFINSITQIQQERMRLTKDQGVAVDEFNG